MKSRHPLALYLLAFTVRCLAQEPNPFVNQEPARLPVEASGESFVTLTEQLLVPADQLDAWLEKNPLTDGAAGLRAAVQSWVTNGSARLDHTAVSTGTVGREYTNDSIWEQSYASEYEPLQPGEWPLPTAIFTRNLGYSVSGSAGVEGGALLLRAKMSYVGMMLPNDASWNELIERTRQPDDVFVPRFRAIEVEKVPHDDSGQQISQDPFAEKPPVARGATDLRFVPGKTYLTSRADNELPAPASIQRPDRPVKPIPVDPKHLVRLMFFRGALSESPKPPPEALSEIQQLSVKLIRVDHRTFSDWMQATELSRIPDLAWAAASGWLEKGSAESIANLTLPNQPGGVCKGGDREEVIYPTEWDPGKILPAVDGKPSLRGPSHASAWDTRNVGTEFQAKVIADPKGPLLNFGLKRVIEGGKSVHHRMFRDGEWQPDATFPIFASNGWNSELRVKRDIWLLVGSGSDIGSNGRPDPHHAVLAFIRME